MLNPRFLISGINRKLFKLLYFIWTIILITCIDESFTALVTKSQIGQLFKCCDWLV